MAVRKNISIDEATADLLDKTGNASAYITSIVQDRWQAWTNALATLRAAEWRRPEILAACDALNGYWLLGGGSGGAFVAAELSDAASLNGLCEKWDVPPARWKGRVKCVRERGEVAAALVAIVSEYWTGNAACAAAIERC